MGFFDSAFDEMTLDEICYRLPSDLAVKAIKRRTTDLLSLLDFIKSVGSQPTFVPALKDHINNLISKEKVDDVLATFEKENHRALFGWLNDENKNRLKNEGRDKLDTKFLFNLTGDKDVDDLKHVLGKILEGLDIPTVAVNPPQVPNIGGIPIPMPVTSTETFRLGSITSVLNKADKSIFPQLMDMVIRDSRPEVRQCVLMLNSNNANLVSDLQQTVALKALAASTVRLQTVNRLDFKLFSALKPKERLDALDKYLSYFPRYRKVSVFREDPSQEEFDLILFAGCIEFNDLVQDLHTRYKEITQDDRPTKDDEEEEE